MRYLPPLLGADGRAEREAGARHEPDATEAEAPQEGEAMTICVNSAHYPTPEPVNALTADPRLHWAIDTECFGPPPAPRFRTIVVDPPWSYKQKWHLPRGTDDFYTGTKRRLMKGRGASANYACMPLDEIAAMPLGEWAEDDAHLYVWVTNAFMKQGHELAEAWGFRPTTIVTWVKNQIGMGVYFRNTTEHAIFCVRGRLPTLRKNVPTHLFAPRGRHSEKPQAFYDMVETVSPGPYLDVFARKQRLGWAVAGNEVYSVIPELAAK